MFNENLDVLQSLTKVMLAYKKSQALIRPHLFLTGASGSGKTYTINALCKENNIRMITINASQITREGVSGNSLSKALVGIKESVNSPTICFVDEFDKIFLNTGMQDNSSVQDEFLTILESNTTQVFGSYGKYDTINVSKVLFVFAGAFNNEIVDLDYLTNVGLRREFLGRVSLVFNMNQLSLDSMRLMLEHSPLLHEYQKIFPDQYALGNLMVRLEQCYDSNEIGVRLVSKLIHEYFLQGENLNLIEIVEDK